MNRHSKVIQQWIQIVDQQHIFSVNMWAELVLVIVFPNNPNLFGFFSTQTSTSSIL